MIQRIRGRAGLGANQIRRGLWPRPPVLVWQDAAIDRAAHEGPLVSYSYRVGKRALDIIGSLLGLLVTGWMYPVIALAIKLESPGPVLFRQWRPGLRRRPFLLYKFRTMVDGAESMLSGLAHVGSDPAGVLVDVPGDPRVTRLGRLLRRTSLDELPQLINILKGEMSLVGPRPFARSFGVTDGAALRRFAVRPGLTGRWQVSGRKDSTFQDAVDKDLLYVDHWSLLGDLEILARTVGVVVGAKGAR